MTTETFSSPFIFTPFNCQFTDYLGNYYLFTKMLNRFKLDFAKKFAQKFRFFPKHSKINTFPFFHNLSVLLGVFMPKSDYGITNFNCHQSGFGSNFQNLFKFLRTHSAFSTTISDIFHILLDSIVLTPPFRNHPMQHGVLC